ncbi:cytochrome C [Dyella acidiphila]|uniref:Cytochrome C n=1 Tax=Dyella acidiphila TaxID=2775866 RepID=A0ABR9GCY8_9GAMM|nr:cytochrome C [Dyella acidiphila]MBE1161913.1 cytochrome C [Dyella acidiphila]
MSSALNRRAPRRPRNPSWWYGLAALPLFASHTAQAVPAYARQTGNACADCHAGAYGPALTPYGMRFKANGYTDTDGNGFKIPAAMQITGMRYVPKQGQSTTDLSEADLYLAGRVTDQIGGYVKVQSLNNGSGKFSTQLNDMDLRFAVKDVKLGEQSATIGVTVNNNPGFADPVGDLPGATANGPPTVSGTLLNPSSSNTLAHRVIGASVYALYNENWYGELGTYNALPTSMQDHLGYGISGDPGKLSDTGYARFMYMRDFKRQFFSVGAVALTTRRQLPRIGPTEQLTDLGYDFTYQFLGTKENILQLAYVNILERRRYATTPTGVLPGQLALTNGAVHDQTLTLSYTFKQSYGVVLAHLVSTGTHDVVRFQPYGEPDTSSNTFTVFWTPFGKDDSLTAMANLKLAATWFRFNKFNGSSTNIFGVDPASGAVVTDAKDLDAFLVSASVAF